MITIKHMDHGYVFILNDKEIAIGEYQSGTFVLLEEDDSSNWPNAMVALSYLRHKYTPEFFTRTIIKPVVIDNSKTTITRYKGHIALQTIDKEAFMAWEQKRQNKH
jgi:hypothetical protein